MQISSDSQLLHTSYHNKFVTSGFNYSYATNVYEFTHLSFNFGM